MSTKYLNAWQIHVGQIKAAARAAGETFFNTGRKCKRGHVANRLVSTGNCVECNEVLQAAFRARNPGRGARVYRKNFARLRKQRIDRYHADPERAIAAVRAWQKRNPHVLIANNALRLAREVQATPKWSSRKSVLAIYREANKRGCHVDHVVPLRSKFVCGLHCEANLQVLPASDNMRKGNRHWPDMW